MKMDDDDFGIKFGPDEQYVIEVDGKLEKVINIDGVSRLLMDGVVKCELWKLVKFTAAIRKWASNPGEGGKPATAEQLKRFDEAVLIAIADKAYERK
jgi:hypothetical protein